jgi:pimeloyl-ACP methyl ester carboxylesterase
MPPRPVIPTDAERARRLSPVLGGLLAVFFVVACGDDVEIDSPVGGTEQGSTGHGATGTETTGETEPPPDVGTTGEEPIEPLPWQDDCSFGGTDLGELHPELECAGIEVPLDWDDSDSPMIQIAVFRVRAAAADRVGQIWLLDGGPGGSGLGFIEPSLVEPLRDAGFDVVVPAHRGTLSPRLRCTSPGTSLCRAQLDDEWGDGLRHFSTLQAAADLGELIERSRTDDDGRTLVYGLSYGTFWAQYYLTKHPDQVDGVILDSVLPMNTAVLEQEALQQELAVALLQRCVDDPECGGAVGFGSGEDFAAAVVEVIESGECGSFAGTSWLASGLRQRFGMLLNTGRVRSFMPLIAAMLHRCTPELTALANSAMTALWQEAHALEAPAPALPLTSWSGTAPGHMLEPEFYYSQELGAVVISTSVLPDDGDPYTPLAEAEKHLVTLGFGQMFLSNYDLWGDIPNAPVPAQEIAEVPVLVLNGTFDLQTPSPWAQKVSTALGQPFVEFDDAAHGVVIEGSADGSSVACGRSLMLSFATSGQIPDEPACLADVPPIDVNLTTPALQALAEHAFGTPDPWALLDP